MSDSRIRYVFLIVVALLTGSGGTPAQAGALQISPVSVELPATEQAVLLTLKNMSGQPSRWQLRLFRWTQSGGQDHLTPSEALAISPPAVTLAPDLSYNVRLVRTQPVTSQQEEAYRLLIDELPDASSRTSGKGLTLLLRASVPVFVVPDQAVPRTAVHRVTGDDGLPAMQISNAGTRHILMSDVALTNKQGLRRTLEISPLNGYVLAGQSRVWTVPSQAQSCLKTADCTVSARVNGQALQLPVQP